MMYLSDEQRNASGWFQPKAEFEPLSNDGFKFIYSKNKTTIDKDTLILYYPGSFGTFHDGHVSVIDAAWKKYRGQASHVVIVISPANSDYLVDKYGKDNILSTNKKRYDSIKAVIKKSHISADDLMIDLNPMLNFTCDHNFTDLLKFFIECHGLTVEEMTHKPVILAGKDREDFEKLNELQDSIHVFHHKMSVSGSTSAFISKFQRSTVLGSVLQHRQKRLFLRVNDESELKLFTKYFNNQYESIESIFIKNEIETAKVLAKVNCIYHTICKDYAGFLHYIPLSRGWHNPLDQSKDWVYDADSLEYVDKVLDSDVYTGGTRDYLKSKNCQLIAVHDFTVEHYQKEDEYELLDFDDFKKPDFCYPFVDISSRCSMQPFTYKDHINFKNFLKEVHESY